MIDKTLPTDLGYISQRKGEVLYIERQEDIPSDLSPYKVIKFKRGIDIVFDLLLKSDTDYMAFGDESAPKPILRKSTPDKIQESTKAYGVLLADLDIRGGRRGVSLYSCKDIRFVRCHFADNTPDPLSNAVYAKYVEGLSMIQCTANGINGDVFYGTGVKNAVLKTNDFDSVNGGGADCIQFSHEGKAAQRNTNVVIEGNILRTQPDSTSGKGAIAIEGTDTYRVENNDVEGQYFGIAANGTNGLVKGNRVYGTDKTNQHSFGIGVTQDSTNIRIEGNLIENTSRGVVISASNPAGANVRENIQIINNEVQKSTTGLLIDVPYSGQLDGNRFGRRSSDMIFR